MKNIPTAQETLTKHYQSYVDSDECQIPKLFHDTFVKKMSGSLNSMRPQVHAMVDFAKIHVEQAQKAWLEVIIREGLMTEAGIAYLENAYPLTLIK